MSGERDGLEYELEGKGQEYESIDDIEGHCGIFNADIQEAGDIIAERTALTMTDVQEAGKIKAGNVAVMGGSVYGADSIVSDDTVMDFNEYETVIADYIEGETLDEDSYGSLVLSDSIDVDKYNGNAFVLTHQDDEDYVTFDGDWERLKRAVQEIDTLLLGLQTFQPHIDAVDDMDELMDIESEYRQYIENLSRDDVRYSYSDLETLQDNLTDEEFGQLLAEASRYDEDSPLRNLHVVYDELDSDVQDRLIDNLRNSENDTSLAATLTDIAEDSPLLESKYASTIEEQLTSKGDLPDLEGILEDSPYREPLEELYEKYRDDIEQLAHLSEYLFDSSLSLDTEKQVSNWEYQRQNGGGERDIDMAELEKMLTKEIAKKKEQYTTELMKNVGLERYKEIYNDVTGEDIPVPDLVDTIQDTELSILEAIAKQDKNVEQAKELLVDGMKIYSSGENEAWLSENGYTVEELTDFDQQSYEPDREEMLAFLEDWKDDVPEHQYRHAKKNKEGEEPEEQWNDWIEQRIQNLRDDDLRLPEEVSLRIAGPRESIDMGNYFQTCLETDDFNGWAAVTNAVDVNKQVIYAENEDGSVVGRMLTALNEDGSLSTFSPYAHTPGVGRYLMEYAEAYADHLDIDVEPFNRNVETTMADDWYEDLI